MKYKMIMFDMDGTLLPMDIDEFTKGYFGLLCKKMVPNGYDKDELIKAVWTGTAAMVANDGSKSNEEAFWPVFAAALGRELTEEDKALFEEFYANEFDGARDFCGYDKDADEMVRKLKSAGYRVCVATNPIFPEVAMRKRLSWAGLDPDGFELITSFEHSSYCKPNPLYYTEIINRLGLEPSECLMVGNDATEDLAALKAGIDVFILTNHLLNRNNVDISAYPQGGYRELDAFIFG